jgi:acyl phosphate:glycerol-3-phosphate acyltransferase
MSPLLTNGLVLIAAYLFGSFPTGFLACKWLKGIDIRSVGSGSTGATNVLRTLGKPAAITVFAIDVLKGVAAIGLARWLVVADGSDGSHWMIVAAGLLAILGHSKPIWLGFKGGKSVAISLGVLMTMDWRMGLGTLGIFLVTVALTRIVSISSIIGAAGTIAVVYLLHLPFPYLIFSVLGSLYVIWLHRANIRRIVAGTEPKLGQKLPQETRS